MSRNPRKEIRAYGIRILLARHPRVRSLKRRYLPSVHGNRFWSSSWLLMDFFHNQGLRPGARVMEVGCGWGLAGIYCAKNHNALVTGVDVDPEVFPFLKLHAQINGVEMTTVQRAIGGLGREDLADVDVLIGADVCFWDKMIRALKRLLGRAVRAGVPTVLIADPGRSPFHDLGGYCVEKMGGEILDWTARRPRKTQGQILKVGSFSP